MNIRLSFRMKLQLVLIAVSLTAVTFFVLQVQQSSVAVRAGKVLQLKTATEGLMDKIDRNLFERYGDVQAYALSESARSGDTERIVHFINDMMVTYSPIYDLMIVTNDKGIVIGVSTKNKNGEEIFSTPLIGANMSKTAWFKKSISGDLEPGVSFVEDLHNDPLVAKLASTNGRVMNFSAPIRDKETGKILGVWSNRMSWVDVIEAITKEEAEKLKSEQVAFSFPYLINGAGTYLFHPKGAEFELKKKAPVSPVGASETLHFETDGFSGEVLEAHAKSKGYATFPGTGWDARMQIPASDPQTEANSKMIGLALGLIFLANVLAFWIIRRMSGSFERVVAQMTKESQDLTLAAEQISSASQRLSSAATEQAAAIEETAASMEEITSMLGQTTQNAGHCKELSDEGQGEVERGKEVIGKMSSAMEEIATANSKLDRLVGLIEDIKEKTRIINDIVSETRLLSFNASIEAARAGVHGKGFAVVADEVGKLAAISGKAAGEIRNLLESSKQEVVLVVKDTQERVQLGKSISHECEVAFNTMGQSFERVNELVRTIANASKEQELGVKQTNRAMAEMDKVTQSNSRGAEFLSQQSHKLFAGAGVLNSSIEAIRNIVVGASDRFITKGHKSAVEGSEVAVAPAASSHSSTAGAGAEPSAFDGPGVNVTRGDSRWKDVG
mgnify:CR=1 FL=1